jgi:hypothetical protein
MDSPVEAQKLIYGDDDNGDDNGPPMIALEVSNRKPHRRKRRKVVTNAVSADQLMTTMKLQKAREKDNLSACDFPGDFPPELRYRALAVYSLLRTLSVHLRLSPFTPNVFLRALYLPYPNRLSGQIHVAILRVLLPQLDMGFSYKSRGGAVGVTKKRPLDGIRWPLRAGDNLTFLDGASWPLFYDDYCHLTADRLWASMNNKDLLLDFRNVGMQLKMDEEENYSESEDEEDEMLPGSSMPMSMPTAGSGSVRMAYTPPMMKKAAQAQANTPVPLDRSARAGRQQAIPDSRKTSSSDSEYGADSDNDEADSDNDEAVWVPASTRKRRKTAMDRKQTSRSKSSTPRSKSPTPHSKSPTPHSKSPTPHSKSPTHPSTLARTTTTTASKRPQEPITTTPARPSKVMDLEASPSSSYAKAMATARIMTTTSSTSALYSRVPPRVPARPLYSSPPGNDKSQVLSVTVAESLPRKTPESLKSPSPPVKEQVQNAPAPVVAEDKPKANPEPVKKESDDTVMKEATTPAPTSTAAEAKPETAPEPVNDSGGNATKNAEPSATATATVLAVSPLANNDRQSEPLKESDDNVAKETETSATTLAASPLVDDKPEQASEPVQEADDENVTKYVETSAAATTALANPSKEPQYTTATETTAVPMDLERSAPIESSDLATKLDDKETSEEEAKETEAKVKNDEKKVKSKAVSSTVEPKIPPQADLPSKPDNAVNGSIQPKSSTECSCSPSENDAAVESEKKIQPSPAPVATDETDNVASQDSTVQESTAATDEPNGELPLSELPPSPTETTKAPVKKISGVKGNSQFDDADEDTDDEEVAPSTLPPTVSLKKQTPSSKVPLESQPGNTSSESEDDDASVDEPLITLAKTSRTSSQAQDDDDSVDEPLVSLVKQTKTAPFKSSSSPTPSSKESPKDQSKASTGRKRARGLPLSSRNPSAKASPGTKEGGSLNTSPSGSRVLPTGGKPSIARGRRRALPMTNKLPSNKSVSPSNASTERSKSEDAPMKKAASLNSKPRSLPMHKPKMNEDKIADSTPSDERPSETDKRQKGRPRKLGLPMHNSEPPAKKQKPSVNQAIQKPNDKNQALRQTQMQQLLMQQMQHAQMMSAGPMHPQFASSMAGNPIMGSMAYGRPNFPGAHFGAAPVMGYPQMHGIPPRAMQQAMMNKMRPMGYSSMPQMQKKQPLMNASSKMVGEQKVKAHTVSSDIADQLQNFIIGVESKAPAEDGDTTIKEDDDESEDMNDPSRWPQFRPIKTMRSGVPYFRLPMEDKLDILEFLIDELLQVDVISAEFSKRRAITDCYGYPYGVLPTDAEFESLENEDECGVCGGEGELLCCDGCIASYHRTCLDMSPNQVLPEGKWLCPECKVVDPSNFGPLRGGRKASLDWFTVNEIEAVLKKPNMMAGIVGGENSGMGINSSVPVSTHLSSEQSVQTQSNSALVPSVPHQEGSPNAFTGGTMAMETNDSKDLEEVQRHLAKMREFQAVEFLVVSGFVFCRRQGGAPIETGNPKPPDSFLTIKKDHLMRILDGFGIKLSSSWPLAQIPSDSPSSGSHFPSVNLYLAPLESFDPSFYASKYRKAPLPALMKAGAGSQTTNLVLSEYESECSQSSTFRVTEALIRDMSKDNYVADCLRSNISLYDPYQMIKGYMLRLEATLKKACLLDEFWETGQDRPRYEVWFSNVRRCKSINRLALLFLKLVDQIHPRAFTEGWFHNALGRNSEPQAAQSERNYQHLPPDWNPQSELWRRRWERTPTSSMLTLLAAEGCPLEDMVQGINTDLRRETQSARSKRKQHKTIDSAPTHLHDGMGKSSIVPTIATVLKPPTPAEASKAHGGMEQAQIVPNVTTDSKPSPVGAPAESNGSMGEVQIVSTITTDLNSSSAAGPAKLTSNVTGGPDVVTTPLDQEKARPSDSTPEPSKADIIGGGAAVNQDKVDPSGNETEKPDSSEKKNPKKNSGVAKRRTRRSGRIQTRHTSDVGDSMSMATPFASTDHSEEIAPNLSPMNIFIAEQKKSKIAELEKLLKASFGKQMHWPIAGRIPFATVGNLAPNEMKRLARNAGTVKAPHVVYHTPHEVGQVSVGHMWRKNTEQCIGLEPLLLQIRVFESFLDRPVSLHSRMVKGGSSLGSHLCFSSISSGDPHLRKPGSQREVTGAESYSMLPERPFFGNR